MTVGSLSIRLPRGREERSEKEDSEDRAHTKEKEKNKGQKI